MKKLILAFTLIPMLAFASSVEDKQDEIVDLAAEIISAAKDSVELEVLEEAADSLRDVLSALEGGAAVNYDCYQYITNKGYSGSTAKTYCTGLKSDSAFECFKYINGKGYSFESSHHTCHDIKNSHHYGCFRYVNDKGYSFESSKNYCEGIDSKNSFSCFQDMVSKGHSLQNSQNECKDF